MSDTTGERTYGNWRVPRSPGLGNLSTAGTVLLFAAVVLAIIAVALAGVIAGIAVLVIFGVALGSLMIKDRHGQTGLDALSLRVGWFQAKAAGSHLYRSGPLGRSRWGTCQLPGLLAQSKLSEASDAWGRPFGLLELPVSGHFSVVVGCEPEGASLVDAEQIDLWVARFGEWLASLGHEPSLIGAAVTVETAPDSGQRLAQVIADRIDTSAPALAQRVLREIVADAPVGSASIRVWVSLTFAATVRGKRRDASEFARDLSARLPGLYQRLQGTGAGTTRPLSAQEMCEVIRGAYDPAAASMIEDAHSQGVVPRLAWGDVGPAAHEAGWGHYRHDGATSVTWMMSEAPRGEVHSSILWRLLAPHHDVARKRVTLLYQVLEPGVAARLVEADKRAADFRVNSATRPSEHALREQRLAIVTAQEEARGAGLVDFGLLVTATVEGASPEALVSAEATVENLAAGARVSLRRVYGSQDSAFVTCLPLGVVPTRHLKMPQELRSAL